MMVSVSLMSSLLLSSIPLVDGFEEDTKEAEWGTERLTFFTLELVEASGRDTAIAIDVGSGAAMAVPERWFVAGVGAVATCLLKAGGR